jgi:hypothetical protein
MNEPTPPPSVPDVQKALADMLGRLSALEQEVAALRAARPTLASLVPYSRPTDEELQDMIHGPRGEPLVEVIDEYEKKHRGG